MTIETLQSDGPEYQSDGLEPSPWPRRLLTTSLALAGSVVAALISGIFFAVTANVSGLGIGRWQMIQQAIRGLFAGLGPFGAMLLLGSVAMLVVPLMAWDGPAEGTWRGRFCTVLRYLALVALAVAAVYLASTAVAIWPGYSQPIADAVAGVAETGGGLAVALCAAWIAWRAADEHDPRREATEPS